MERAETFPFHYTAFPGAGRVFFLSAGCSRINFITLYILSARAFLYTALFSAKCRVLRAGTLRLPRLMRRLTLQPTLYSDDNFLTLLLLPLLFSVSTAARIGYTAVNTQGGIIDSSRG